MEVIFDLVSIVVPPVVILAFSYMYFGGRRLNSAELGVNPLFQEQCGGRFDNFNLTVPFVRHSIYEDFVVFAYGKTCHVVRYSDITRVEEKQHLFSSGLEYYRKIGSPPYKLIIWSRSPQEVIKFSKIRV